MSADRKNIKKIRVRVPATTANLGPGFDVLGAALKLYNEVTVTVSGRKGKSPAALKIDIVGEGKDILPRDDKNIVWQSMRAAFKACGYKGLPGLIEIRLNNGIPLVSGLGSSAAARLCGILAGNAIAGGRLSANDIADLGTKLEGHPDNIVPSMAGGLCVSIISSGKTEYIKLSAPAFKAVVCTPDFRLETKKARQVLPKSFTLNESVFNCSRVALLVAALCSKRYEYLSRAMEDMFHQPSRARLVPGMMKVFAAAKSAGAYGAALSGAGPSIVAFSPAGKAAAVGKRMRESWKANGVESRVFTLDFDKNGAKISTY